MSSTLVIEDTGASAPAQPVTKKFTIILVGRQSYSNLTQEFQIVQETKHMKRRKDQNNMSPKHNNNPLYPSNCSAPIPWKKNP